jgi:hypothetical protein
MELRHCKRKTKSPFIASNIGATDEVGNCKTVVPDSDKWGARFEELVQLTGLLER